MRVMGRGSIASIISIVVSLSAFVAATGLLVAVVLMLMLPFTEPSITVTVPVSFSIDTSAPIRNRSGFGFDILDPKEQEKFDQKRRIDRVDGSLRIPNASKPVIVVNAIILVGALAFMVFVLTQLRAVLQTLIHGNPFVPSNATHIRRIGLAVIVGELAGAAIVYAENYYAMTHVAIAGLQFDDWPRVSFTSIGYGLIILVIAEVFRAGTRLDEEQSLTV